MISGDGLFKCRTVRRVVREEACNQKFIDDVVTPIDEYVQKGAKTSFEYVRVHRNVVEGHAPIPEAPGRAFVPRRVRLSQKDFEDFGYTEECMGLRVPANRHSRTKATVTSAGRGSRPS